MVNWNKCFKMWDIAAIKVSVAAFTLFAITYWTSVMDWAQTIEPMTFLIVALIFGAKPFYEFYIKNK